MTAAILSKDRVRFVIEMKNFIPRWLPFVPRFPQAKRTLEMCHSQPSAAVQWDFSILALSPLTVHVTDGGFVGQNLRDEPYQCIIGSNSPFASQQFPN